jgi:F-type H+-transporting ATPase subunit alpha
MNQIGEGEWDDAMQENLGNHIAEAIDDFGPDFDAEGNPLEEGESDRVRSEEERKRPPRAAEAGDDSGDNGSAEGGGEGDAAADEREEAPTA